MPVLRPLIRAHNYQCTTLYTSESKNRAVHHRIRDDLVDLSTALKAFKQYFQNKTAIAWDDRIEQAGKADRSHFQYQPPPTPTTITRPRRDLELDRQQTQQLPLKPPLPASNCNGLSGSHATNMGSTNDAWQGGNATEASFRSLCNFGLQRQQGLVISAYFYFPLQPSTEWVNLTFSQTGSRARNQRLPLREASIQHVSVPRPAGDTPGELGNRQTRSLPMGAVHAVCAAALDPIPASFLSQVVSIPRETGNSGSWQLPGVATDRGISRPVYGPEQRKFFVGHKPENILRWAQIAGFAGRH
ncbi:hypothetical protein F4861DRAFT_544593 [Xylaria intraflava]|nr:hypothetical protein F4861DRAFT_544593 [Xylaria intraflava]